MRRRDRPDCRAAPAARGAGDRRRPVGRDDATAAGGGGRRGGGAGRCAGGARLPFPNASFGLLITVHVLHLVGPWREALREFRRVLRPDGLYLNSHNYRPTDSPNVPIRAPWHGL